MSQQPSLTTGALTTNGVAVARAAQLTYAEAVGGTLTIYEGSTSGKLISTIVSSDYRHFVPPLQCRSTVGIYVTLSAGSGVLHYI